MLRRVVLQKLTDVSDMPTVSIIRAITHITLMETGSTSKTSVNFCETTRRNIPEATDLCSGVLFYASVSYSGGPGFKYYARQLTWLRFVVVLISFFERST
jgi:hypothetical protein